MSSSVLPRYADKIPFLQLSHTFLSPSEALTCPHTQRVAPLFPDSQMPDMRGLDFARLIVSLQKPIVFTTAYVAHAVEGLSLQALDYLLKPIEFGRFLQACNRAYAHMMPAQEGPTSIFVKDGYDRIRVIQSDTNLLFIHEQERQVSTRMTITDMLATLPAQ